MLRVTEIFRSIQGESTYAGKPCVFVRLAGCDLRCTWCDTAYAFNEGQKMSVDEVLQHVDRYGSPLVEVTGGEPLLQEDVYPLMERLLQNGRTVLLERDLPGVGGEQGVGAAGASAPGRRQRPHTTAAWAVTIVIVASREAVIITTCCCRKRPTGIFFVSWP